MRLSKWKSRRWVDLSLVIDSFILISFYSFWSIDGLIVSNDLFFYFLCDFFKNIIINLNSNFFCFTVDLVIYLLFSVKDVFSFFRFSRGTTLIFMWFDNCFSFLLSVSHNCCLISMFQFIKDATQGSEPGKTLSLYVLDALICIDHEKYFLNQLQSRGFLRSCLMNASNVSYQVSIFSVFHHIMLLHK